MTTREIKHQEATTISYNEDYDQISITQKSQEFGEDVTIWVTKQNAALLAEYLNELLQEI
jgi:hypothetical protein